MVKLKNLSKHLIRALYPLLRRGQGVGLLV
jgi:hypothetical protein